MFAGGTGAAVAYPHQVAPWSGWTSGVLPMESGGAALRACRIHPGALSRIGMVRFRRPCDSDDHALRKSHGGHPGNRGIAAAPPMMNDLGTITLPPRLRAAILSELKPGEHVIWMDQPDPEFIGWNSPTDVGFGLVFLLLGVGLAWMFAWEMRDPMSWTHDLALAYQYGEGRFAAAIGDFVAVGVGILLAILGCWLLLSPWRRRKRARFRVCAHWAARDLV